MSSFGKQKGAHHDSNLQPVAKVDAHIKVEIEPAFPPPLCLLDGEPDGYGLYHCIRVRRVAPDPAPALAEVKDEKHDVLQSPVAKNEDDDAAISASACPWNIRTGVGQNVAQGNSLCIGGDPSLTGCTTEGERTSVKPEIDDDPAYHLSSTQDNGVTWGNVQTNALAISSVQTLLDIAEEDLRSALFGVLHDENLTGDLSASTVEPMEDDTNSGQDQDLNSSISGGEFSMGGEGDARDLPADIMAFAMDHDTDQDLNQVIDEDILPSHSVSGRGVRYVATDSPPGCVWHGSTPDYGQEHEEEEEEEEEEEGEREEKAKEVSPPSSPDEQWNDAEFSLSSDGSNCSVDNDYQMREISSDEPDEDNEEPVLPTNPEPHSVDHLVLPSRGARSPVLGLEYYRDLLALTVASAQDPFPSRPSLKETVDIYKNREHQALDTGLGSDMDGPQLLSEGRSAAINLRRSVSSISGPSSSSSDALSLFAEASNGTPTPKASTLLRRRSKRYLEIPNHDRTTRSMGKGQVLFKQLPGYGTSIKNFLSKIETVRGRPSRPSLAEGWSPGEEPSLGEGSTSPPRDAPATRTRKSSVSAGNESPRRRRKTISRSKRVETTESKGKGPAVAPVITPLVNKFLHLGGSRNHRSNSGPSTGPIGASTVPRTPSPLGISVITHPLDGYSYFGHLRSPEPAMSGHEMGVPESSRSVKRARRAASAPATSNTFNFGDLTISGGPQSTYTPLRPSRLGGNASSLVHGPPTTRLIHPLRTRGGLTGTQHRTLRYPVSTMASQQNRSDSASTAPGETAAFIPASFGEIVTTTSHDWTIANANRWIALANATVGEGKNLVALGSTPGNSAPSSHHPGNTTSETESQGEGRYIQMPDSSWVNVADMAAAARYTCGSDGKWSKIE